MLYFKVVVTFAISALLVGCGSSGVQSSAAAGSAGMSASAGGAGASSGGAAGASGNASGGQAGSGGAGASSAAGAGNGGSANGGSANGGSAAVGTCTPPSDVFSPIETLSLTGCTDPTDTRKPIARAVAYEVNSPLWSDSADKQRAFVLPAGGKIHVRNCTASAPNPTDCPGGVQDDGRWDFPVGTVMIKIFSFDQKLVETRLFMHLNADNWVGYSYEWNEAQTDAKIVSTDRVSITFNTQTRTVPWHYPSQEDCLTCHNQAAGFTLGPETAQMNRLVGGMNQLDRFSALGLFDAPLATPYKAALVTPYTGQLGSPPASATNTQEARSYLHANCGFCHRPGGAFALFDLRNDTLLKDTNICNVTINKAAPSGAAATKEMSPGHAADSAIWQRMTLTDPDAGRMPQIGTYAVDSSATKVVGDWIDSLSAADCTSATQ